MGNKTGKIVISAATAALLCLSLAACGGKGGSGGSGAAPAVGKPVATIAGVELDYDNAFFDGFDNGVDYNNWYIGNQAWGESAGGNGGVIPQNVGYTDDGVLVLSGNGEYYRRGEVKGVGTRKDGSLAGAALISRFTTRPGHYEIKMKVLPRQGACSAFWTYAYDNDTRGNHEIDIELPGGKESGVIGFDNVLNTNYVTEGDNISQDVTLSNATGGKVNVLNDGKWHTFGFDWYTLEPGEYDGDLDEYENKLTETDPEEKLRGEADGKVVYYIDGVVTAVGDAFVPYYESRLWLGVWFPHNTGFVGDANFENDYMYVDYVSYVPFKDQPCVDFTPAVNGHAERRDYPTHPITTVNTNMLANGSFEYVGDDFTRSGWTAADAVYSAADENAAKAEFEAYFREHNAADIEAQTKETFKEAEFKKAHSDLSQEELEAAYEQFKESDGYATAYEAEFVAFKESADYAAAYEAAFAAVKKTREYRRAEDEFVYPTIPPCYVSDDFGARQSRGVKIEDCGMLRQLVDSIYGGFRIDLSADVMGEGAVVIRFLSSRDDASAVGDEIINVNKTEYGTVSGRFTAPAGTRYVQVQFTTRYGKSLTIDNAVLEVVRDDGGRA